MEPPAPDARSLWSRDVSGKRVAKSAKKDKPKAKEKSKRKSAKGG
jgi:hypothetical protein